MQKAIRGAMILFVSMGIAWFGFEVGPHSDNADAKVFEIFFSYTRAMPDYLFESARDTQPRKINVNGNQTLLTVQKSEDGIGKVLDFYAGQYEPLPSVHSGGEAFRALDAPRAQNKLADLYNALDCLKSDRRFRYQTGNYGILGTFEFRDRSLEFGDCEFNRLLSEALETGKLGRLGTFRVTMVMAAGNTGGSTVVNIWTDETFDLNRLYPDAGGDMPGKDVEDVPRFPGALRKLSLEQKNHHSTDRVVIYESDGSPVSHILFYHSRMKSKGWRTDDAFAERMKEKEYDKVMFYKRDGRECMITIEENDQNGRVVTTVTERENRSV